MKCSSLGSRNFTVVFAVSIALTVSGCVERPMSREPINPTFSVDQVVLPFRFGEVHSDTGNINTLALVSPSQTRPFIKAQLSNGFHAWVILGDENKICRIRIVDEKFDVGTISMQMCYREARARFPKAEPIDYVGYGIEMRVKDNVVLCFFPWNGPPEDNQKPAWIDLLPEKRTDRCSYAFIITQTHFDTIARRQLIHLHGLSGSLVQGSRQMRPD